VAKTVDSVTTAYVLDPAAGLTQVLQETTGGQATSYLYGHDLLAQYDSGTWAYHLNDGLGSVRQLADLTGQVVQSYSFSPFGVPLGESGGEPYGYTGEQWDASTGLVFLRARYYQPEVGRFVSRDPVLGYVHAPRSQHPYVYAWNNPVRLIDPSGQQVSAEVSEIVRRIVWIDTHHGVDALIRLFETDELDQYDPPAGNSAQARLELVLQVTNKRLPRGIDAGIQFEIDFSTCGLQERFNDEWLYTKYWDQNPDDPDVANQVGHFLTAVRLGYDPTFLVPLLALEGNLSVSVPQVRPLLPMDESIEVTAKRLIVGHEKKGDPAPKGSEYADAVWTAGNIPLQYRAAELEDVNYFDLAVAADRDWRTDLRDYYRGKILGAMTTEDLADLRKRQGNSMEDLRLSVKGWRLGRAVAGLDGNAQPPEKQLITRLEVASWLRIHIAMPGLP
jgi:RHS repeat-associated protein